MKAIDFKSNITTFVPAVGDYFIDADDKLYIVTKRALRYDGTFTIFITLLSDEQAIQ